MKLLGMEGLIKVYKDLNKTVDYLKNEIRKIDELFLVGDPKSGIISFGCIDE